MIQTRACLRFGLLLATIGASGSAFGAIRGLQALFAEGDILQDRNGDGLDIRVTVLQNVRLVSVLSTQAHPTDTADWGV